MVPLDSPSIDLRLGGWVFFRWMHNGGKRGSFHHLGTFAPRFGGYKEPASRDLRENGCGLEGQEG